MIRVLIILVFECFVYIINRYFGYDIYIIETLRLEYWGWVFFQRSIYMLCQCILFLFFMELVLG